MSVCRSQFHNPLIQIPGSAVSKSSVVRYLIPGTHLRVTNEESPASAAGRMHHPDIKTRNFSHARLQESPSSPCRDSKCVLEYRPQLVARSHPGMLTLWYYNPCDWDASEVSGIVIGLGWRCHQIKEWACACSIGGFVVRVHGVEGRKNE